MGFNLQDYVTNAETIEPTGFSNPDDGTYEFELTALFVKEGSQKNPDAKWIIFEYQLDNGRKTSELFGLPKDPDRPTDAEQQTLGRYLNRLISLGVPRNEVNTVDTDTLIGKTGTLTLRTTTSRKNQQEYQNISRLSVEPKQEMHVVAQQGRGFGGLSNATPTSSRNPFEPGA